MTLLTRPGIIAKLVAVGIVQLIRGEAMKFSFVTFYVRDIKRMTAFYEAVFGLKRRFIHESGLYVEMETGSTVLSFAQMELARTIVPQGYVESSLESKPANVQIGLEPVNVKAALRDAIACGAVLVSDYEVKPWGWESAMIRDIEGNLVELARRVEK